MDNWVIQVGTLPEGVSTTDRPVNPRVRALVAWALAESLRHPKEVGPYVCMDL